VQRKKRLALRYQLGYYESIYSGTAILNRAVDTLFLLEHTGRSKHQLIRFGTEAQISKKKFRAYFGADLGYRHWTGLSDYQKVGLVFGQKTIVDSHKGEIKASVIEGSVLAGVNYFFLPRLSIGLEANASAGLELSKTQTIRDGSTTATNNNTLIEFKTTLIRLLYLSYHFGK
jgi:hypothetical protein